MFFQVCCFKNAGVAGYVKGFETVQLGKQASYMVQLFRNRCTRFRALLFFRDSVYCKRCCKAP